MYEDELTPRERFFKSYPIGELFTARGELVQIKGYNTPFGMAIVIDEDGKTKSVAPGLLRRI